MSHKKTSTQGRVNSAGQGCQAPYIPKKGLSFGLVLGWSLGDEFWVLGILCLLRVFHMPDTLGHVLLLLSDSLCSSWDLQWIRVFALGHWCLSGCCVGQVYMIDPHWKPWIPRLSWASLVGHMSCVLLHTVAGRIKHLCTSPLEENTWKHAPGFSWIHPYLPFPIADSNLYLFTEIRCNHTLNSFSVSCKSF